MKKAEFPVKRLIYILILVLFSSSCNHNDLIINDITGILGKTHAPVIIQIELNKNQITAVEEGRLALLERSEITSKRRLIPVQLNKSGNKLFSQIVMIMPEGSPGIRKFKMTENKTSFNKKMKANLDAISGQAIIETRDQKVLQYNYQTIFEKDVIRLDNEKLNEHSGTREDTFVTTSIYAVPRSDYIHPLYGLEGEILTKDWPEDGHPHHRAIFWAWPEVEFGSERGDIYALQRIFARPSGKINFTNGPVFAEIVAENFWMWEDTEAIVREIVVIRAYCATAERRIIDLTINLEALEDSISIATRNTDSYGGLNLRMMTPEFQEISYYTDKPGSKPLRSWSDFNGKFEEAESKSGLMVLQHRDNPDYPGEWVEYPNLAWVQPTFPTPGTRFSLIKQESLTLRYRLIIHTGGKPDEDISKNSWDTFHGDTIKL